jgi:hypothetical protein
MFAESVSFVAFLMSCVVAVVSVANAIFELRAKIRASGILDREFGALPDAWVVVSTLGRPPEEAVDRAVTAIDKVLESQLNFGDYRRVHAALTQSNKMFQWRYLKGLFAARIRALAGRAHVGC